MSRRKRRDIPEINDDLVDRVLADTVALVDSAIRKVKKDTPVQDREDWFKRPFDVCELLADRLSTAEWCLKEEVSFESYIAILDYMNLRETDDRGRS